MFDPGPQRRIGMEKYSRVLASVICPPFPDIALEMIRRGMVHYYEKRTAANPEYDHQLSEAYEQARTADVGLWSLYPDFHTPPWEYRKKHRS